MAMRIICGRIAVERRGGDYPEVCISLPGNVDVIFGPLNEMVSLVGPLGEKSFRDMCEDRRKHNQDFIDKVEGILESGNGDFGRITAANCEGGIVVTDHRAAARISYGKDEGGVISVKLDEHDTRCLLYAMRGFAASWRSPHGRGCSLREQVVLRPKYEF